MSSSTEQQQPVSAATASGGDDAAAPNDDSGGGWSEAAPKRRRQPDRPKFLMCLDQARRGRPVKRALVMATQPQAEPLFPGCSDSETEDSDSDADAGRDPKFVLADVQCLMAHCLLTYRYLQSPRWCRLIKPGCVPRLLVVIADSVGPGSEAVASLPTFLANFYQAMRLLSPYAYGGSVGPELFSLPLHCVALAEREPLAEWLARQAQPRQPKPPPPATRPAASAPAIGTLVEPPEMPVAFPDRDKFPRTQLLLSSVQLLHENYPIPGLRSGSSRSAGYRTSLPAFKPAGPGSPMYGLDCEMVVTEAPPSGAQQLELARATLVDESGRVLLDQLVKPPNPVVNYLTPKSGITQEMMEEGATVTLEDVQDQLARLLPPDAILVGHSLNCDLHALRMCHPSCIDTSVVFNLSGSRRHKAGLRVLAQRFLGRDIQSDEAAGHSSVEDATAALELVQLKLARSLEFGDAAGGHWNPAIADDNATAEASTAKRARLAAAPDGDADRQPDAAAASAADGGLGGFHASVRGPQLTASGSLFDWLRLRGVSFRVFDRAVVGQDDGGAEYLTRLPPAYLVRGAESDAAAVAAARAELKCSRFVVLRLRHRETGGPDAGLAALDTPLAALYDALPLHSLAVFLLPGERAADGGGSGNGSSASARCYFSMKGMVKPAVWAGKA